MFSTFDLKRANHHITIKKFDMIYTGFEAYGVLYHFHCIPFDVINGVAFYERAMDKMIKEEGLNNIFPYLDNITIPGKDQEEKQLHSVILEAI